MRSPRCGDQRRPDGGLTGVPVACGQLSAGGPASTTPYPTEEPRACRVPSAGGGVMAVVQVGEQAGLSRLPAEGLTGDEIGRRVVLRDDVREEPEVPRHHQY